MAKNDKLITKIEKNSMEEYREMRVSDLKRALWIATKTGLVATINNP
jgi:hypothetical protein